MHHQAVPDLPRQRRIRERILWGMKDQTSFSTLQSEPERVRKGLNYSPIARSSPAVRDLLLIDAASAI
jgi:hypothetical protein